MKELIHGHVTNVITVSAFNLPLTSSYVCLMFRHLKEPLLYMISVLNQVPEIWQPTCVQLL